MATRMIVTSQPDVACDVCGRRLLRGEQPDVFLASGRRRTVCELCAPRASAEGWMRETDQNAVSLPPARPRRGRNLLGRLRQSRERVSPASEGGLIALPPEPSTASYDFLDSGSDVAAPLDGGLEPVESPAPLTPLAPDIQATAPPVPAVSTPDADPDPAADSGAPDVSDAPEEEQEGSWRDAWMFVKE
jgi:hypothetical protein